VGPAVREGLEARVVVRRPEGFVVDLDLSIPAGRTVALLGPNGAGKSTTVAALAGLLPMDEGCVALNGTVLDDPGAGRFVPPEARRVGVVFQDHLLFPHLTVLENVAFGLRSQGTPRGEAVARAKAWLERMGLPELASRRPGRISGGQAQRVALARALAPEPELLLLDEPLSALDVSRRAEIRGLLAEHLEAFPGPRLLITHEPLEAFRLADEIHVLEGGRVTQAGSAEDIRLRPRTAYAADLAGTNLLDGVAADGVVRTGEMELSIADPGVRGPVRVSIPSHAVAVHRERPEGSPRNRWRTTVERVEGHGYRVRLLTGPPLPLMVEVTQGAASELALVRGAEVWLAVKATEIGVEVREATPSL
jgi:molybdate transport system ATP-binding protein